MRMAAEMAEQPEVIDRLLARREAVLAELRAAMPAEPLGVVLVARGSSDNAAVYGRYLLALATRRPVALAAPSLHTLYGGEFDLRGYLVVAASQSGETPEIVSTFASLVRAGGVGIAVTNDAGSALGEVAPLVVELEAGPERAVPATKTFTAQLAAFALIAEAAGPVAHRPDELATVGDAVRAVLDDPEPSRQAAARLAGATGLIVVGRGFLYAVALEAALKLKEAALVLAEGCSAADVRHGPIAVLERDFPVLALSAPGAAAADMEALFAELGGRGVAPLHVGVEPGADLPIPAGAETLAPFPPAVRAQQLALELALARGIDPDHPAGLAKVTPTR